MVKETLKKIPSFGVLIILTCICIATLVAAYILEHYFHVNPCQMCLYERNVFIIAGTIAFVSLFLSSKLQRYLILFLGLIFLGGALLASYHVAIQQHWVAVPGFCAVKDFSAFDSVSSLREQLLQTPFVRCDKVTWALFGLSLAAYNTLLSLGLAFGCWLWSWGQR